LRVVFLLTALLCALPARAQFALSPELLNSAAGMLAQWIESSRAQALQQGVRPMPLRVQCALAGYFPADILAGVRYSTGGMGGTGGFALPWLAFQYGDAAALTLGDVIVFRDPRAAESDLKLWSHELTHVQQYQRWGTQGFAARYVRDSHDVEHEAYANADRFVLWHNRVARTPQATPPSACR